MKKEIFGNMDNTQFFVDGGLSLLRSQFKEEPNNNADPDYNIGFQAGAGFLFPMGKQIVLETKLGFQAFRQEFTIVQGTEDDFTFSTETRWLKEVALNVGLKVKF